MTTATRARDIADGQTRRIATALVAGSLTAAEIAGATRLPDACVRTRLRQCGPGCFTAGFRLFAVMGERWVLTGRGREKVENGWRVLT